MSSVFVKSSVYPFYTRVLHSSCNVVRNQLLKFFFLRFRHSLKHFTLRGGKPLTWASAVMQPRKSIRLDINISQRVHQGVFLANKLLLSPVAWSQPQSESRWASPCSKLRMGNCGYTRRMYTCQWHEESIRVVPCVAVCSQALQQWAKKNSVVFTSCCSKASNNVIANVFVGKISHKPLDGSL